MNRKKICDIINGEMMLATGCTEPAAIALAAATARAYLQGELRSVDLKASVNIIKNAFSVHIPGTDRAGMQYAAALGAVIGHPQRRLMVMDHATPEEIAEAVALVDSGRVRCGRCSSPEKLYVEVSLESTDGHSAKAVIAGRHTGVCHVEQDGEVLLDLPTSGIGGLPPEEIAGALSLEAIYSFVEGIDREKDDLHMIEQAIEVNRRIAERGEDGDYGLNVGRMILKSHEKAWGSPSLIDKAVALTASGIDARMAGADVPVVTNSGSGNQGITATVPILAAAEELGVDDERCFRAVTLSHLVAIHIHTGFGLLSGLCGATIAAAGAACGLVYLMGGSLEQICMAVNNMLGDVTGMLCDGAKADCALKVTSCVYTAFRCAFMALENTGVSWTDGIVERDAEKTIENFVRLGNEGSPGMDNIVLDIMLKKNA